jgi:mono/diheme cytochrome c family protein
MPAAVIALASTSVWAADPGNGKMLAQRLCVNCHQVGAGAGPAEPTAGVPSFAAIAAKPEQTSQKIQDFTINPHPSMPQVQLTVYERADLAAYIMSLKGE